VVHIMTSIIKMQNITMKIKKPESSLRYLTHAAGIRPGLLPRDTFINILLFVNIFLLINCILVRLLLDQDVDTRWDTLERVMVMSKRGQVNIY
jgi:hypothetical protein